MNKIIIATLLGIIFISSCKKDETENPFDSIEILENETPDFGSVEPENFAYLHEKIFLPTCANSGCHDGTFEPEFRSISSSYNSLVNHPVISNDEANTYEKRVTPGSSDFSLLNARLTSFLPNTSGIMPLEVDEESDWTENSNDYISLIQSWINSGAPDMYGNLPGLGGANLPPSINGLLVFPQGETSSPYVRDPNQAGITPILVENQLIDVWILIQDDQTPTAEFSISEIHTAEEISELNQLEAISFSVEPPLAALDFSGNNADYILKATLDLSSHVSGDIIYLRNYLNDGDSEMDTEIPNANSTAVITSLFVLEII